jgi:hypothetical protein
MKSSLRSTNERVTKRIAADYHGSWLASSPLRAGIRIAMEQFRPNGIFSLDGSPGTTEEETMPYTRPIRRFYLTPPSVPLFVASIILALLAVLAVYGKMSIFNASYAFLVLLVAYLVLLVGVLFRGV